MPKSKAQISVVVPLYNEVENAEPLLLEIEAALTPWAEFEIIAVDDFSSDGTQEKLMALKQKIPSLRVIRHQKNLGQSNAIVTGTYAAHFDCIATLDGDGQNNPADIAHLFEASENSTLPLTQILVAGNRQKRNDSAIRLLSSRIANFARRSMLKDSCPDSGCGLKLFSRTTFLKIPHFKHVHRFLPALFIREGASIINVPITHRARTRGKSKYGVMNRLWVGIVDIIGVSWLIRRPCPTELSHEL